MNLVVFWRVQFYFNYLDLLLGSNMILVLLVNYPYWWWTSLLSHQENFLTLIEITDDFVLQSIKMDYTLPKNSIWDHEGDYLASIVIVEMQKEGLNQSFQHPLHFRPKQNCFRRSSYQLFISFRFDDLWLKLAQPTEPESFNENYKANIGFGALICFLCLYILSQLFF